MTSTGPKLPIWRTAIGAYTFLFKNWREAVRIGWLPLAAAVALSFLTELLPSTEGWPTVAAVLYGFANWAAYTPIVAMTVVPWHRFILLGHRARGGALAVSLSAREGRYAMLTVVIVAIVTGMNWAAFLFQFLINTIFGPESIFGVFLNMAGFFLYLAAVFAVWYLFALFGLALPAVAVDRDRSFNAAVKLGRGNGWRLIVLALAAAAPGYAFYWAIGYLPLSAFAGAWMYAWTVLYNALFIFGAFIAATILSLCYRALGGLSGNEPGPTMIPPMRR